MIAGFCVGLCIAGVAVVAVACWLERPLRHLHHNQGRHA